MVLVADFLQIEYIKDLELLTNLNSLNKKNILNVEITETPDVEYYISPNTFILTTGMIFKDNQLDLIEFINSLIRAKATGLAVKTGRFLNGKIDDRVIEHANRLNFPIINIPDKYPLGRLLHQLSNYIWNHKQEEIEFALKIQQQFSSLLLNNTSIETIINEFSNIIKCPIILLNPIKRLLVASDYFKGKTELISQIENQFQNLFHNKTVPDDYVKINISGETKVISVSNVFVYQYFPHYLLILNPEKMTYPTSTFAIDQAKLVLSYSLYKSEKIEDTYLQTSSTMLLETLNLKANTTANLYKRSHDMPFIDSQHYQVIEITDKMALKKLGNGVRLSEKKALIRDWFSLYGEDYFGKIVLVQTNSSSNFFVIIQEKIKDLEKVLIKCRNDLQRLVDISLIYSVGDVVTSIHQISRSLDQSLITYRSRVVEMNDNPVEYYNSKGLQTLFQDLNEKEVVYFCISILKELAYPETDNQRELRETLKVYLDCQCEATLTAHELFVHRNTVKYRIEKCQELLGMEIRDPKNSLNIRLALTLSTK
ncbi:PucR family transcriptional regulator [Aerococcaceae bacterium zg-ZUI334]|uniref:PucR family transcriptional regulator n=1 Tax=Aerococcaceae bacterium zg-252 TaxID=2796928 RepID=UPI001BA43523|nr:PucR family transcriptional regulator [Aerococcaceae bacterium zg-ZUI334]